MARRRIVDDEGKATDQASAAERTVPLDFQKGKTFQGPACEQCGARLTITHLGAMYPCGHDPKVQGFGRVWNRDDAAPAGPTRAPGPQDQVAARPDLESAPAGRVGAGNGNAALGQNDLSQIDLGTYGGTRTVRVVWGKELYSPKQFHTYEVGPFEITVAAQPGETLTLALARACAELAKFAEGERERKRESYLRSIKG